MDASGPDSNSPISELDPATQEKIREFCYELALALRRITGKVVVDDIAQSSVDENQEQPDGPKQNND
jgi:hypothetical protein